MSSSFDTAASNDRLNRLWSYAEADPGNAHLLRDIAGEALRVGAQEQALKALDLLKTQGLTTGNDEAAAIHTLLKQGRIDEACHRGEEARQAWPEADDVRLELARALLNARRFNEVLAQLGESFEDMALAQMSGELQLHALWQLGRLDDAAALGAALSERWPDNPRTAALASAVFFDLERMEEAFALARKAYTLSPPHAYQALHVLASERLLRQDLAGAFKLLDEAQQSRQDDGRIWLLKGAANMVANQLDEATENLQRALTLFPEHPGSYLTMAWVHMGRKNLAEAEATVRKALEVSPAFAESHGTLAAILVASGRTEEARESLRRATLLDKHGFAARYAQALLDGAPPDRIEELFRLVLLRSGLG